MELEKTDDIKVEKQQKEQINKENKKIGLFKNLKQLIIKIKKYWSKPQEGFSVPYKEIFLFCLGGIGIYAVVLITAYITLGNALYIGAALRVRPNVITLATIINTLITFIRGPLVSAIVDNTKSKYGKFRPHLIWLPIPLLFSLVLLGWIPYLFTVNGSQIGMLVSYIILFNIVSVILSVYTLAFQTLPQVMSPNTEERTKIIAIGSVVYSLGPSILNLILPILSNILFAVAGLNLLSGQTLIAIQGYNMIGTFQWLLPIIVGAFLALGYLCSLGTKERMVISKDNALKVKFFQGVKLTFKNKYFWVYNIGQAFQAFRLVSFTVLAPWAATYVIKGTATLGIVNTILGPAYLPGMILAPLLIKKIGKKQLQIWTNAIISLISVISIFVILKPAHLNSYSVGQGWAIVALAFFTAVAMSPQVVILPALTCQMYDYQQYKTGDRIEGFLSQFGASILALLSLAVVFLTNWILEKNGVKQDYSVLNNAQIFKKVMTWYLIISAIGGILTSLCYIFWDLTEDKHDRIMEVLRVRKYIKDGIIPKDVKDFLEEKIEKEDKKTLDKYIQENNIIISQQENESSEK